MAKYQSNRDDDSPIGDQLRKIPANRTLLVTKCTDAQTAGPKIVYDLENEAAVYHNFKPEKTVFFEGATSGIAKETLRFNSLEDFDKEALKKQSVVLQEHEEEKELYFKAAKVCSTNTKLAAVLKDDAKKKELIKLINSCKELLKKGK